MKMFKIFTLLALITPALAQDITNHAVPVGGGPGFSGFRAVGPCSTGQTIVWNSGTSADPSCATTVIPVAAACDGTTDDTAVINAAETALNSAGGGTLVFPKGVCIVTGVTKRSSTIWQGQGIGVTVLRLKASTTANAVISGLNAYTLFGTSSFSGIENWTIQDFTIDGNRANSGASDCIGVYGWAWKIYRVESMNCTGWGIRTEYPIALDGQLPDHGDNASSWLGDSLIHDNNLGGVSWAGPQDSVLSGNYVYRNLVVGIKVVGGGGVALKISDSHVWGSSVFSRQATTGLLLDGGGNKIVNCLFEGSTGQQIWLRSSGNVISGTNVFYVNAIPNTVYGIRIGEGGGTASGANSISAEIENTNLGALFFDNDAGSNLINVTGFNSTGGSVGYAGTPHAFDIINFVYGGGVTNPTLSTVPGNFTAGGLITGAALQVLSNATVTNGLTIPTTGTMDLTVRSGIAAEFVGVVSGVNFFQFSNGATGSGPGMLATGTDTNVGWGISSKGAGTYFFFSDGFTAQQFGIGRVASANRFLSVAGSNGGNPTLSSSAGGVNIAPSNGHIPLTGGSAPTLTAGCNGAGNAVSGTDAAGTITGQTAAATTCTLTFGTAYSTAPNCVASGQSSPLTGAFTVSASTIVVNFGSTANYKWSYVCFGT